MKINIESTPHLVDLDGVPCRLWEGITERGAKCKVFVHRLAVPNSQNQEDFDLELQEEMPPGQKIDLRHCSLTMDYLNLYRKRLLSWLKYVGRPVGYFPGRIGPLTAWRVACAIHPLEDLHKWWFGTGWMGPDINCYLVKDWSLK